MFPNLFRPVITEFPAVVPGWGYVRALSVILKGRTSFFHRTHIFKKVLPWDGEKFGREVITDDPRFRGGFNDPNRHPKDPPIATFFWHLGCRCGATAIAEMRGPM